MKAQSEMRLAKISHRKVYHSLSVLVVKEHKLLVHFPEKENLLTIRLQRVILHQFS